MVPAEAGEMARLLKWTITFTPMQEVIHIELVTGF